MRAGLLDRRIIIESKSESISTTGLRENTWSTFLTVWADELQKLGKESDDDMNRGTERETIFKTRYNSTITVEMRIQYQSRFYKIVDMKELGRQDGWEIKTMILDQS